MDFVGGYGEEDRGEGCYVSGGGTIACEGDDFVVERHWSEREALVIGKRMETRGCA